MNQLTLQKFLKYSACFIFAGRAYQHLFWDAPFRSLFWDQNLLEPIVTFLFNNSWQAYVTNLNTDTAIQILTRSIGILYVLCAIISLRIRKDSRKWEFNILKAGSVSLVLLALLLTKEKFYHVVMFFEHAIQFGVPIALIYFLKNENIRQLLIFLKVCIALAFTCHGMYALGVFYPLPGNFVTMSLNILPITEEMAKNLLFLAGILDIIIAIAIFIPQTTKIALLYASFWGFITAVARILSGLHYDISFSIVHQYFYLVVYRLPHGIIPLLVYLMVSKQFLKSYQFSNNPISV